MLLRRLIFYLQYIFLSLLHNKHISMATKLYFNSLSASNAEACRTLLAKSLVRKLIGLSERWVFLCDKIVVQLWCWSCIEEILIAERKTRVVIHRPKRHNSHTILRRIANYRLLPFRGDKFRYSKLWRWIDISFQGWSQLQWRRLISCE